MGGYPKKLERKKNNHGLSCEKGGVWMENDWWKNHRRDPQVGG